MISKITGFLGEVKGELRKASWPWESDPNIKGLKKFKTLVASTIVVETPRRAKAIPSSTPMYPPPITAIDAGNVSSDNAPALSSTRAPSTATAP